MIPENLHSALDFCTLFSPKTSAESSLISNNLFRCIVFFEVHPVVTKSTVAVARTLGIKLDNGHVTRTMKSFPTVCLLFSPPLKQL